MNEDEVTNLPHLDVNVAKHLLVRSKSRAAGCWVFENGSTNGAPL